MVRSRPSVLALATALLALAMLSFATVQSIVMQTAMVLQAAPVAVAADDGNDGDRSMSEAMPGMDMGDDRIMSAPPADRHAVEAGRGHGHQCPYCAAAAHLPMASVVPVPHRTGAVAFASFLVAAARGPRGPPSFEHRARGPPGVPEQA